MQGRRCGDPAGTSRPRAIGRADRCGCARLVWRALPFRVRLRASVATRAFDNTNGFDLVGLPKLAGIVRGPTDVILASSVPGDLSQRHQTQREDGLFNPRGRVSC